MSCFLVSDEHIDFIVGFFLAMRMKVMLYGNGSKEKEFNPEKPKDAVNLGEMLISGNQAGVNYRYKEKGLPRQYICRPFLPRYISDEYLMAVTKAIDCLDYQSCDHPEWGKTDAREVLVRLKDWAIQRMAAYESAPYEINENSLITSRCMRLEVRAKK